MAWDPNTHSSLRGFSVVTFGECRRRVERILSWLHRELTSLVI